MSLLEKKIYCSLTILTPVSYWKSILISRQHAQRVPSSFSSSYNTCFVKVTTIWILNDYVCLSNAQGNIHCTGDCRSVSGYLPFGLLFLCLESEPKECVCLWNLTLLSPGRAANVSLGQSKIQSFICYSQHSSKLRKPIPKLQQLYTFFL